jgi:hypothetical protein
MRLKNYSYQGMPSGMPFQSEAETGFSRCARRQSQLPKADSPSTMLTSLKRCPDTNCLFKMQSNPSAFDYKILSTAHPSQEKAPQENLLRGSFNSWPLRVSSRKTVSVSSFLPSSSLP